MEDFREELTATWLRAELPRRVRDLVEHYLEIGLPEVPLAYPTNWGVEGTGPLEGQRIDVYAEVGLAWLYGVAQALDPSATTLDECAAAWRDEVADLWQFHGIDNTFYFAIFWPALFAAAGIERLPLRGLVVNEFFTLDGAKFSTSRDHAIWAHEFLRDEDPEIVRLYLSWDRPDRRASGLHARVVRGVRSARAPAPVRPAAAAPRRSRRSSPTPSAAAASRRSSSRSSIPRSRRAACWRCCSPASPMSAPSCGR